MKILEASIISDLSILESLNDGVYATDRDRRIIYWNKASERITGWNKSEVINRQCSDHLLCHEDKDGRRLCQESSCPLFRSIVTGEPSVNSGVIYAQSKRGGVIPMQVSVAPVRNARGEVVGGVLTFRDASHLLRDLERARGIQNEIMHGFPADDPRLTISRQYVPLDLIGGDFYSFERLDADHYAFILADLVGHGIASALYTMRLRLLLDENLQLMWRPAALLCALGKAMKRSSAFANGYATALCGVVDLAHRRLTYANAGHPPALLFGDGAAVRDLPSTGIPLGLISDVPYDTLEFPLAVGDTLLCYTDCAIEAMNALGEPMGLDGFLQLLESIGFPGEDASSRVIQDAILNFSNAIQLQDDLTLLTIRMNV